MKQRIKIGQEEYEYLGQAWPEDCKDIPAKPSDTIYVLKKLTPHTNLLGKDIYQSDNRVYVVSALTSLRPKDLAYEVYLRRKINILVTIQ